VPALVRRRATAARSVRGGWSRLLAELSRYVRRGVFLSSPAASRYCVGRGLEIGGSAHNPFGLAAMNVDMTDSLATIFKQEEIELCGSALKVDIVAPGDCLPVADGSQDFVVSSHVLEHFPNPIGALLEWDRVVRPGGVIYMIVPHRDRTFEADLPRTTLAHLIEDYEGDTRGPEGEPMGHNHVWVTEDVVELVQWMQERFALAWEMLEVKDVDDKVGNGFALAIRKRATRQSPVA